MHAHGLPLRNSATLTLLLLAGFMFPSHAAAEPSFASQRPQADVLAASALPGLRMASLPSGHVPFLIRTPDRERDLAVEVFPTPADPVALSCPRPSFLPPFEGPLTLRSAYRSYLPHAFRFCPQWSSFGPVRAGKRAHGGVDIAAVTGTPVQAAMDGALSYARDPGGYGLYARLRFTLGESKLESNQGNQCGKGHPEAWEIVYAHLKEDTPLLPKESRNVQAGEIIGYVGCTGNAHGMCSPSPESHLHVTVERAEGKRGRLEPLMFLAWNVTTPSETDRPVAWQGCHELVPRAAMAAQRSRWARDRRLNSDASLVPVSSRL